jgi:hypothetical protein
VHKSTHAKVLQAQAKLIAKTGKRISFVETFEQLVQAGLKAKRLEQRAGEDLGAIHCSI